VYVALVLSLHFVLGDYCIDCMHGMHACMHGMQGGHHQAPSAGGVPPVLYGNHVEPRPAYGSGLLPIQTGSTRIGGPHEVALEKDWSPSGEEDSRARTGIAPVGVSYGASGLLTGACPTGYKVPFVGDVAARQSSISPCRDLPVWHLLLPWTCTRAPFWLCATETELAYDNARRGIASLYNHNFDTVSVTYPEYDFFIEVTLMLALLTVYINCMHVRVVIVHMPVARMLVFLTFLPATLAVCPGCFGNAQSCTYDTNGQCPTLQTQAMNAQVVAGLAAAAAATVTLTNVVSTRFLRMFSRAHLQAVMQLVRRQAPGTIFELKKDTKLQDILVAVAAGQLTMEQAATTMAGFIDDETDEDERKRLMDRYKMIIATKDFSGLSPDRATVADVDIYTWLWGKITCFVADRGMQVTVDLAAARPDGTSTVNVLTTTVKRFKEPTDFFESLNLFVMFCSALGLCSAVVVTEFLEHVVFDTIRMRGHPWQLAAELLVVMLRRIGDSGGRLNLANCINETYLNTVLDEASELAKANYPAHIFRTRGGTLREESPSNTKPYNGRFTKSSNEICKFFNAGTAHPPSALHPDGTCRKNHICDKFVSNKGKGGQCLGTAGTPGHARHACDNPHKCDAPVQ
jgi:hypothetical protein